MESIALGQAPPFTASVFDTKPRFEVPRFPAGDAAPRKVFSVVPPTDVPPQVRLHERPYMPHLGNPETDLLGLPDLLTSRAKATMARERSVRAEGSAFDGRPDPKGRRADCRKRYEFKFGYPTPQAAEKSNDDTNLTRAVTAYRFCYPTISMEATFEGPDKGAMILSGAPRQLLFVGSIEQSSMQTLEADYFATYRNVKLSRDVKGVLIAEFHSYGGPFIMMGDPWRIPRQQWPHTSFRAGFVLAWFLATAGPRHDLTRSRARAILVT